MIPEVECTICNMGSVLAETLGRQLLHSDIWILADKCADLVKRIHEPLERSVAVLDDILTLEDDDTGRTVAAEVFNGSFRPRSMINQGRVPHPRGEGDNQGNRQFIGEFNRFSKWIVELIISRPLKRTFELKRT